MLVLVFPQQHYFHLKKPLLLVKSRGANRKHGSHVWSSANSYLANISDFKIPITMEYMPAIHLTFRHSL